MYINVAYMLRIHLQRQNCPFVKSYAYMDLLLYAYAYKDYMESLCLYLLVMVTDLQNEI